MKGIVRQNLSAERLTDEGCFILQSWGLPADGSLSLARARVEVGQRTRWHRLHGVREIYLITEGSGLVELGGEAPRRVGVGDLVHIPPELPQRIAQEGRDDLVFYCICTPAFTQACYEDMEGAGAEKDKA